MSNQIYSTIIIGAGASGLMAGNQLAGTNFLILEKNKPGQKILAAGGGRCNFAPQAMTVADYTGQDPRILRQLLSRWSLDETLQFFTARGVTIQLENDRYYPALQRGRVILEALLQKTAARITTGVTVEKISQGQNFLLETSAGPFWAKRVIVAAGGPAAPQLGGDKNMFEILARLGHTINPLSPALVGLEVGDLWLHSQSGYTKLVAITEAEQIVSGPLLFTHQGISGPLVFDHAHLWQGPLSINFWPEKKEYQFNEEVKINHLQIREYLEKYFSTKFVTSVISRLGITERWLDHLPRGQREELKNLLFRYPVVNYRRGSWAEAQAKAGGVPTTEIDPKTMESKIVPGLYLTGETLDITGRCGGFNLAWAWLTGAIAGRNQNKDINTNPET